MTIEFTVPGRPVPMARPRVTAHGTYTPAKCREYKQYVAMMARQAMRHHEPMTGAVHLILQFTFQTPKSWTKVKKACADIVGHTSRPDWDNLAKSVTDAMIGIVYKDDSQIETATVDKRYGESDGVRIVVEEQQDWRDYIDNEFLPRFRFPKTEAGKNAT